MSSKAARLTLIAVTIGGLVVLGGSIVAAGGWLHWRAARYAARAKVLLESGARDTARRACLRALAFDRDNISATRTLLALAPVGDLANQLLLRARLADLEPADPHNLKALATTAIYAHRFDMAERAIRDLAAHGGDRKEVLDFSARSAAARGDFRTAEVHAQQLLALDPANPAGRLIQGLAQVFSGKANETTAQELSALTAIPTLEVEAFRGLRELALQRHDPNRAMEFAEKAAANSRANFADHLTRAELLTEGGASADDSLIVDLTAKAGKDPQALAQIAVWMRRHGRAADVERWLNQTPALQSDTATARLIRAEHLAAVEDWSKLDLLLTDAPWGGMEFLRLALLARSARRQGDQVAAARHWRGATAAALESTPKSRALAEAVGAWPDWSAELDDFLWRAVQAGVRNAAWALTELQQRAMQRQDTRSLRRVSESMVELYPDNEQVRNNLVFYTLLLGSGSEAIGRSIQTLYTAHSTDAAVASTYALWLLRSDRPAEALAALEKLPPTVLAGQDLLPYHALALARAGQVEQARALANRVEWKKLLPEEQALLRSAGLIPPGT